MNGWGDSDMGTTIDYAGSWQDWLGVVTYISFAGFVIWRVLATPAQK
jgi:hypothetical protein